MTEIHNSQDIQTKIKELAKKCNDNSFFETDPVIFPKHFAIEGGFVNSKTSINLPAINNYSISLQDVEIAAVFAAHLAWGRRDMIVRDIKRVMEEMNWKPYSYIMNGKFRNDDKSLHRTIKWREFAIICRNLASFYEANSSLEILSPDDFRTKIYGQKSDIKAANKKIHMLRRWMVRNDGIIDIGIWKSISPKDLIIPLDVHVHRTALQLGITQRKSADYKTAEEITTFLKQIFPNDPAIGDFALFAYAASFTL